MGGAVTSLDYRELARDENALVVLVNWALRIAPLFRGVSQQVFFFSWHMDLFYQLPEMRAPRVKPVVYKFEHDRMPPESLARGVDYEPANIVPYEAYLHALELWAVRGQDFIDETNRLITCSNTTLMALLFVWHTGCREINVVGMHDRGGVRAGHYDPRLKAQTEYVFSTAYVRDVEDFCRVMGMRLNYLGER